MVPVNNYKILFYFTEPFNPSKGGVERVSIVLGKWLTENGCTIFYLSNKSIELCRQQNRSFIQAPATVPFLVLVYAFT